MHKESKRGKAVQVKRLAKDISSFLIDLVFPNRCPVCNGFLAYNELICGSCIESLPYITKPYCEKCGKHECVCKKQNVHYDSCFSFVYYAGRVRNAVMNLKLNGGLHFAEYFARKAATLLEEKGIKDAIDIVTFVPMTRKKQGERGYNQAYEFAKYVSENAHLPKPVPLLEKTDNTLVQHSLSAKDRKSRAEKAYALRSGTPDLSGKTVLLCDDVITTGSTLNSCSRVLKDNGVRKVVCLAIANTRHQKSEN